MDDIPEITQNVKQMVAPYIKSAELSTLVDDMLDDVGTEIKTCDMIMVIYDVMFGIAKNVK